MATALEEINLYIALRKDIPKGLIMRLCEYTAQLVGELAKLNYIELPNEQVSNVFEAYIAWKNKANKLEAENERLRKAINRAIEIGHVEYLEGYLEQEAIGCE